jgi:poly-gamma-glutamate synthesis protein (capsule biosynthesis protein)
MAEPVRDTLTLFLCGDVMTGRGIDQILPFPSDPVLHEPWVKDARDYVLLAEQANGSIPRPVDFSYVWGDALEELQRSAAALRIVNLETSVTVSDQPWPGKGIHYRMNPRNVPCLTAARIDACSLANNHVLDWGYEGLAETLGTLRGAGIGSAGAGRNREESEAPVVLEVEGTGRCVLFALGSTTSGIPAAWAAGHDRPGVAVLHPPLVRALPRIAEQVRALRRPGDRVVVSIHWGGNWGYEIPGDERDLAHALVDEAGVDIVHGHSSHHPKGFEVYGGRLILYGCGDFLTDYEGIHGHEEFRGELCLMYFPTLDASGRLVGLRMRPMRLRRFRIGYASRAEAEWLARMLNREGRRLGTEVAVQEDGLLTASSSLPSTVGEAG